jgi:hypothetical protein
MLTRIYLFALPLCACSRHADFVEHPVKMFNASTCVAIAEPRDNVCRDYILPIRDSHGFNAVNVCLHHVGHTV